MPLKLQISRSSQRWSPRGHILKSSASNPQVLEKCLVLGSRTALFFEWLKFCRSAEKCFSRRFFFEIAGEIFLKTFIFENTCVRVLRPWPWPRAFLSLALASDFFCVPGLGFEPYVLDSTSDSSVFQFSNFVEIIGLR